MNKNNKEKLSALIALAALRKKANWEGFSNISDFADGIYDSDYVSPYTKGAGNIDSRNSNNASRLGFS